MPLYAPALRRFSLENEIVLWQQWAGDDGVARDEARAIVESEYGLNATKLIDLIESKQ
jgi:hypothetical protein